MPYDAIVVGAGPAGAVAAIVLARAGARVRLLDRARFPRHKLCGDTLNPGALAALRRLGLAQRVESQALRLGGMVVTGVDGARVVGTYAPQHGLAIRRIDLDALLLEDAVAAGVAFEDGVRVSGPIVHEGVVTGVRARLRSGREAELTAPIIIAADGRRSALAFGLGLARLPRQPRRYAIGAYFEHVTAFRLKAEATNGGNVDYGEMHIRGSHYLGVAPLPGGLTNACLVVPQARLERAEAMDLLEDAIRSEPAIADRFAGARMIDPPVVLGPLAVDVRHAGLPGLLLAGDAAGFIDPMTGDGLRFAIRGGELAGEVAADALANGVRGAERRLADVRRREFARKWLFDRGLRRLAGSMAAVRALSLSTGVLRPLIARTIAFAGDSA